jgi:hypothetical protein
VRGIYAIAGALVCLAMTAACENVVTRPSSGALVLFDVEGERFRIWLNAQEDIDAARRAKSGAPARIPNGRIVGGTEFNHGWSWHLEDVEFAEAAIEICDGRPSDVEREGPFYGGGRYCPWGAGIVTIEEF